MGHREDHDPFLLLHLLFSTSEPTYPLGGTGRKRAVMSESTYLKLQTSHLASVNFSVLVIKWGDWGGAQQRRF